MPYSRTTATELTEVLRQAHRADPDVSRSRRRLGEVLVSAQLINSQQLTAALAAQTTADRARRRLGMVVADLGFASETAVATALADHLGLLSIDLTRIASDPGVVRRLPRQIAERFNVLLLGTHPDGGMVVAMSDPTNVIALDDVRLHTRVPEIFVTVAAAGQIREHLARCWSLSEGNELADLAHTMEPDDGPPDEALSVTAGPIVRMVNETLADATRLRASDIHVEPQRDHVRIRYRVDGVLREVTTAPRAVGTVLISRMKIMGGLDIAQRRIPQDGRAQITVDGRQIDTRISTLPSMHGEKVVVRLLTRANSVHDLTSLGFDTEELAAFRWAMHLPQGLVLITGPTGSGKTNTLYAAIAETSTPERNIVTLEDPVEVQLPGITQVQVNPKAGLTFESGLRSVLRQDPDTILVGEVRDPQTAELAMKAAVTGHLVFTTLHTSSAAGAVTRLVDMGVAPYLVASALSATLAQRLVRVPCQTCAEPYEPSLDVQALLGLTAADLSRATPRRGTGCYDCGQSGYLGRTAVFEMVVVDAGLRGVLLHDPTEAAVSEYVRARGGRTLLSAALAKAMRGETTFEEVLRVAAPDLAATPVKSAKSSKSPKKLAPKVIAQRTEVAGPGADDVLDGSPAH
ncbi:MAG: GspE/PulE family protein [Actinomycetales bacterium]